jgi:hypothetical protein
VLNSARHRWRSPRRFIRRRIRRRGSRPPLDEVGGVRGPAVVDQVVQPEDPAEAEEPGDSGQRDALPEVRQLMRACRLCTASAAGPAC